jgi:hypothetical protein
MASNVSSIKINFFNDDEPIKDGFNIKIKDIIENKTKLIIIYSNNNKHISLKSTVDKSKLIIDRSDFNSIPDDLKQSLLNLKTIERFVDYYKNIDPITKKIFNEIKKLKDSLSFTGKTYLEKFKIFLHIYLQNLYESDKNTSNSISNLESKFNESINTINSIYGLPTNKKLFDKLSEILENYKQIEKHSNKVQNLTYLSCHGNFTKPFVTFQVPENVIIILLTPINRSSIICKKIDHHSMISKLRDNDFRIDLQKNIMCIDKINESYSKNELNNSKKIKFEENVISRDNNNT